MNEIESWRDRALRLEASANRIMVGQERGVRLLLIATFARGHVLLEGDVGVGKTTLLQTLARGIGGAFERIEGTVDLMPSDLLYYTYLTRDGQPRVEAGPLLRHGPELSVFFFNEINRARPQVHSLMLRAMAERSVSAFNAEHRFPHLQVFADRNRIEREETFEIPAAVRDRFLMEITIEMPAEPALLRALMTDTRYHDTAALIEEMEPGTVPYRELNDAAARIQASVGMSGTLQRYALDLWSATRNPAESGHRDRGRGHGPARAVGGEPARHEHAAARGACRSVAGGPHRGPPRGSAHGVRACGRAPHLLHSGLRDATIRDRPAAHGWNPGDGRIAVTEARASLAPRVRPRGHFRSRRNRLPA